MSHFDVVPRLPRSSSLFVNFQCHANTVHGIIVAPLTMTSNSKDSSDNEELDLTCLLVLSVLCKADRGD